MGSFSYTSHDDVNFIWGVSLTHTVPTSFLSGEFLLHIPCFLSFLRGLSLTHLMLVSFLPWEFLLYIPCWLHFYLGIFSYTSALASFLCGKFLLHIPCWLFLCGEFLSHIPCCLHFHAVSFSYTSSAVWISTQGISLTHPKLAFSFFLFCFFIWGVSLTDPEEVSLTHAVLT